MADFNKLRAMLGIPVEDPQATEKSNFDFSPNNIYNNLGKMVDPVGTENRERAAKIESLKQSIYGGFQNLDPVVRPMNIQDSQKQLDQMTPEELKQYMQKYPIQNG